MDKIKHVKNSIIAAEINASKLNPEVLALKGQTGVNIKHMLNNIINFKGANHLEIGVNMGATLAASLYKNTPNWSYAVEIDTHHNELLEENKKKFELNYTYLNEDCFNLDLSKIKEKINVYYFDGGHDYEDHYKSLEYYYSVLNDEFIFLVDDWLAENDICYHKWKQVVEGTRDAIRDLNLEILFEKHKPRGQGWHGGIWISVLKKKK